jgi:hypothetical protein
MKEIWKDIENYERRYQISSLGRVKSLDRIIGNRYVYGKELKLIPDRYGYFKVNLSDCGIVRGINVHRVVAETFIPNPENLPQINHINGVKTDNRVENLEWCTSEHNLKHAFSTGFDYTGIDCIIFGISTASIALYYQIVGRGTRIDADKKDCLIIDLAGNVERFGRVEDITFEKGKIWRMFGTGSKLLSGIPIHDIGKVTKEDVCKIETNTSDKARTLEFMPFGKYKGERISDIPADYKKWMLDKFEWTAANENLRKSILMYMNTEPELQYQ